MGTKVFSKRVLRNPDLKRNSIDLSRINHLTTKIGQITPVFVQEVVPGDSFNIKTDFGFRFMPMSFPVQSPIRADIHFFYVRTRTLWDNFKEFRFNTIQGIEHPFISTSDNTFFANGSLADYLGLPTSQFQDESDYQVLQMLTEEEASRLSPNAYKQNNSGQIHTWIYGPNGGQEFTIPGNNGVLYLTSERIKLGTNLSNYLGTSRPLVLYNSPISISIDSNKIEFFLRVRSTIEAQIVEKFSVVFWQPISDNRENIQIIGELSSVVLENRHTEQLVEGDDSTSVTTLYYSSSGLNTISGLYLNENIYKFFALNPELKVGLLFQGVGNLITLTEDKQPVLVDVSSIQFGMKTNSEIPVTQSPFAIQSGQTAPRIPVSALPFRAYEAIYNSFFRNTIVSPFRKEVSVNGVMVEQDVFDDYVSYSGDGADTTPYKLYQRNWEKDVFTSAWKTPQFGETQPLVGATSNQKPFAVQEMQVNDGGSIKTLRILVGDEDKVVGINRYSDNFPMSSIDALQSAIEYGISINDLRNVDALQIWLENNVANGYKYKDEMLSHFGVNIDFSILSMPEYIGGVSRHLNMNTIYQSIETEVDPLGSFAGVGNIFGQSEYDINKYCEEDGFIIGVLSLVPVPSYSQLLPRYFQKYNFLDYYNHEFSQIGMQPIFKKDVSPLTTTSETQNETFGYTKPNWEYLQATDEVHGDFRDKLRNFVINREFANTPELVQDFIEIRPTEVNDIFSYKENTDKIVGMVSFKVNAKRPIPIMLNPQIK